MTLYQKIIAFLALLVASLAAQTAAASIQYSSNNPSTGFDTYANGSLPSGWTNNSGTWAAYAPANGYAAYLLPNHTKGLADGSRTNGDVATYTGTTAIADAGLVATQLMTVASSTGLQAIYVGVDGNASNTQGYLLGTVNASGAAQCWIYRKVGGTITAVAKSGTIFTPSTTAGTQYLVHQRIARVGSGVYGKCWVGPASAEPAAWTITYTDGSPLAAGYAWLFSSSFGALPSGPFLTDLVYDDTPYGETNSISVTTPATFTSNPLTINGAYQGTVPTGINYALDGATAFTAASSPTISGGTYSFNLPTTANGYHQLVVQASNATTETAATASMLVAFPATAYTLSGPPGLVKGQAGTFTLAVAGTLSSSDTISIVDGSAGGTFSSTSPVIPSNTNGSSSVTFTYTPANTGAVTISAPSDSAGLTAPAGLNYTVTNPPLTMGSLSASANRSSITITVSAALSGGAGSGYSYSIYRGIDPNFTEGVGTLLATSSALPYVDNSVVAGALYFYGVTGTDGATTLSGLPSGIANYTATSPLYVSSSLQGTDLNLVFIGDSRTYCQYCSANNGTVNGNTPPYWAATLVKNILGLRNVYAYNGGVNGASSANWLKGQSYYTNAAGVGSATGMQALMTANPSATKVFSIMLDANDANQSVTASTYRSNVLSAVNSLLSDWPGCYVIVHQGSYFTPNIYAGPSVLSLDYSYRAATMSAVASAAAAAPGHVFMGDQNSWAYFAKTYASEMASQASYGPAANGNGYLHQNDIGARSLGAMWAAAMATDLYGVVGATFRAGFH